MSTENDEKIIPACRRAGPNKFRVQNPPYGGTRAPYALDMDMMQSDNAGSVKRPAAGQWKS